MPANLEATPNKLMVRAVFNSSAFGWEITRENWGGDCQKLKFSLFFHGPGPNYAWIKIDVFSYISFVWHSKKSRQSKTSNPHSIFNRGIRFPFLKSNILVVVVNCERFTLMPPAVRHLQFTHSAPTEVKLK